MGRSGLKQERERRNLLKTLDWPLRTPKISKGLHICLLRLQWGRNLYSKLLKLAKTDVWGRLLSIPGTRGGSSKALTLIPAAWGIKDGVMEPPKV